MQPNRAIYAKQAEICRGLAHPVRLEVVHLLGAREIGFGALLDRIGVSKPTLSQHLAVLRAAGIVTVRRDGARAFYRLKYPDIETACQAVAKVLTKHLTEVQEHTNALLRTARARRRSA
jgi:ArsR family transcriptional regulator